MYIRHCLFIGGHGACFRKLAIANNTLNIHGGADVSPGEGFHFLQINTQK